MPALPIRHPALWALAALAAALLVFAVVALHVRHERVRDLYRRYIGCNASRERLLIASLGFYTAFAAVRVITHAIRAGRGPFHDVAMGGRHIHHLVWGVLLLLLVGYASLWQAAHQVRIWSRFLALAFGVGAALTLDEFALWLNLRDVYWERQGRASIDAVILFSALLSAGIAAGPFFRELAREAAHPRRKIA